MKNGSNIEKTTKLYLKIRYHHKPRNHRLRALPLEDGQ